MFFKKNYRGANQDHQKKKFCFLRHFIYPYSITQVKDSIFSKLWQSVYPILIGFVFIVNICNFTPPAFNICNFTKLRVLSYFWSNYDFVAHVIPTVKIFLGHCWDLPRLWFFLQFSHGVLTCIFSNNFFWLTF